MKNIEVTDELLYKYMPIADEMELDALEAELKEDEFQLSPKFEKSMQQLFRKEKYRWIADFGKFMLKVAVVCIGILCVSLAVTMSVDAYRSKFFQTVQEMMGDDSVIHTYDMGDNDQEFILHEPTYIPEGYEEVSRIETEYMVNVCYINETGEEFYWDQIEIEIGEQYVLDSEYINKEYHKLNDGYITVFYYESGYKCAYYETDNYVYILSAQKIDVSDIILMFESIK